MVKLTNDLWGGGLAKKDVSLQTSNKNKFLSVIILIQQLFKDLKMINISGEMSLQMLMTEHRILSPKYSPPSISSYQFYFIYFNDIRAV